MVGGEQHCGSRRIPFAQRLQKRLVVTEVRRGSQAPVDASRGRSSGDFQPWIAIP